MTVLIIIVNIYIAFFLEITESAIFIYIRVTQRFELLQIKALYKYLLLYTTNEDVSKSHTRLLSFVHLSMPPSYGHSSNPQQTLRNYKRIATIYTLETNIRHLHDGTIMLQLRTQLKLYA